MKMKFSILTILILFIGSGTMHAQFLKKLGNRAVKAAENTVMQRTDQEVTKETDKALDTLLSGKKGRKPEKEKKSKATKKQEEESRPEENVENVKNAENVETVTQEVPKLWSKYNFVPGDEIIFYDDLEGEENGEFPSRWDILRGNAENAELDGENVIAMKHSSIIIPLMDTDAYLPEVFTLEFDIYFDVNKNSWRTIYYLDLGKGDHGYHYFGENNKDWTTPITIKKDGIQLTMDVKGTRKNFSDAKEELKELGQGAWRHIAVAFNKRSLKIFIDEHRVLNIPNLGFKPEKFSIGYWNNHAGDDEISVIKNIRLAKGGKKLYDQILEEGRFVTRGILFDVNKATLKPESMGVINEVAKLMQKHMDLKFEIVGHTDAQGDDGYNLELSTQRAYAVMDVLVAKGIESSRIKATGMGEKIPVADNTSAEGRANNRRVEFVKMGNF